MRMIVTLKGSRYFVSSSIVAGISSGYFFVKGIYPLVLLVLLLWFLEFSTWREFMKAVSWIGR